MMEEYRNKFILGDAIRTLEALPDGSVDMLLVDLPYGVTKNKKDLCLPFPELWSQYLRVVKPTGAMCFFSQGLFYVDLVNSMRKYFRYDIIWDKVLTTGFLNAPRMPLRSHEQVAVFYRKLPTYNPQFTEGEPLHGRGTAYLEKEAKNNNYGEFKMMGDVRKGETQKYPKSIITFPKPHPSAALHRTEKPVECLEWLINTYTNPGDLVLDNTAGSGGVGVACLNTGRDFFLVDNEPECFRIMSSRLK